MERLEYYYKFKITLEIIGTNDIMTKDIMAKNILSINDKKRHK